MVSRWIIVFAALALAGSAGADEPKPLPFDKSPLYTDGKGHYLAYSPPLIVDAQGNHRDASFYFGNGRVFYGGLKLLHDGYYSKPRPKRTFGFYDSRFPPPAAQRRSYQRVQMLVAELGKSLTLRCGSLEMKFVPVDEARTRAIRKRAKIRPRHQPRSPLFLARDDTGRYYFVDMSPDVNRIYDLQLYIGRRGGMKKIKLRNVANDAAGVLLVGKQGTLKLGRLKKDGSTPLAKWKPGKGREIELTVIRLFTGTKALIYDDLGVYHGAKQGTPCDWL